DAAPGSIGLLRRAGGPAHFAIGLRREAGSWPEATVFAGPDGHFEFPVVRSGDWRIRATSDPGREAQASRATIAAVVGGNDGAVLQTHMAAPFKLTGAIEWEGEDGAKQPAPDPRLLSGVMTLVDDGRRYAGGGIVDSGKVTFENILPGRYQLLARM